LRREVRVEFFLSGSFSVCRKRFSFFDVLVSLLYFLLSRLFDFLLHRGKESLETTREEQRKKLQGFTMLAIKNKNKKA